MCSPEMSRAKKRVALKDDEEDEDDFLEKSGPINDSTDFYEDDAISTLPSIKTAPTPSKTPKVSKTRNRGGGFKIPRLAINEMKEKEKRKHVGGLVKISARSCESSRSTKSTRTEDEDEDDEDEDDIIRFQGERLRTPGRLYSPETGKRSMKRWEALVEQDEIRRMVVTRDFEEARIQCDRCYVEPMEWMGSLHSEEGDLRCPNEKCRGRLGRWNWKGETCSCGFVVRPCFALEKKSL